MSMRDLPFSILPGFGEREPRPSSRQEILDAWAEMFAAVDNCAVAAELSQPGVTSEPLNMSQPEPRPDNVVYLDQESQKRGVKDLAKGTIIAASDQERRQLEAQDAQIEASLARVYDIHDGKEQHHVV